MPYATLADLIARAGDAEILQVADRDNTGVADQPVIDAALAAADRMIDASLAMRYALPLDPTPGLVRDLAVSIARYLLHRDGAPDYVVRDHEQALKTLREAASGRIALPGTSSLAPIQAPGGTVSVGGSGAVFTDDALGGWR